MGTNRRENLTPSIFLITCLICLVFTDPAEAQQALASSTARHAFSDAFKSDYFKLTLKGTSIIEADCTFEILDPNGKSLYVENFTADMLLRPGTGDTELSDKQKEEYIRKRVDEFFKEEHFYRPAIDLKEEFDMDINPDLKAWELVRADRTCIGFGYCFAAEKERKIAWVKKWKKMTVYSGN